MDDSKDKNGDLRFELIADSNDAVVEDPLQFVSRALRGRYRLTALLAILLALCGAIIGYSTAPVRYESVGLIHFKPTLPTILYKSDENQPTPLFDSFVSAQATLIRSRHIIEEALRDSELQGKRWVDQPMTSDALVGMIKVNHRRGEQVVSVTSTHREPVVAQIAVNAVLRSFDRSYHDPIRFNPTVREQKLVQREGQLEQDLLELGELILELSDQYGVDTIKRLHSEKVQALIAVDQQIADLNRALIEFDQRDRNDDAINIALDFELLAGALDLPGDEAIIALYRDERVILNELERLDGRFGPRHPAILEQERLLRSVRDRISAYERSIGNSMIPQGTPADIRVALATASSNRLQIRVAQLAEEREAIRQDATELGVQSVALATLDEREQMVKIRLQETRQALDILRVESNRDESTRINIASFGELPTVPSTDRRRAMASAAALFGAGLAGCLVVVLGIFDPRCRYAMELQRAAAPMQVICQIPELSEENSDSAELAALGVHQLRNLLEVQRGESSHSVFTVTSPHRQEGKTSLALALGASFAVAGRRTLLIDADIARAGLTAEMRMSMLPGLCEAIGSPGGGGEIHQTEDENLWALPVGNTASVDSRDLARDKLATLLESVRDRFDVILFDTGPVLTSLEASLVASISDDVILTVASHQHGSQVRASLDQLQRIGARCAGLVFNRAPRSDFDCRDWHVNTDLTHAAPLLHEAATRGRSLMGTIGRISTAEETSAHSKRRAA